MLLHFLMLARSWEERKTRRKNVEARESETNWDVVCKVIGRCCFCCIRFVLVTRDLNKHKNCSIWLRFSLYFLILSDGFKGFFMEKQKNLHLEIFKAILGLPSMDTGLRRIDITTEDTWEMHESKRNLRILERVICEVTLATQKSLPAIQPPSLKLFKS